MITLLLASTMAVLEMLNLVLISYPFACYTFLTLFIITVSCIIIIIKVKSNPPPQHFNAVASERKLTVTLSIVTVVSILTILPTSILKTTVHDRSSEMSLEAYHRILAIVFLLYYANSMVNPFIYAIRMQDFRKVVKEICKRNAATRGAQDIELHVM